MTTLEKTTLNNHVNSDSPFQVGIKVWTYNHGLLGTISKISANGPHIMATVESTLAGLTNRDVQNINGLELYVPKPSDF